jgi:hypothetical protein
VLLLTFSIHTHHMRSLTFSILYLIILRLVIRDIAQIMSIVICKVLIDWHFIRWSNQWNASTSYLLVYITISSLLISLTVCNDLGSFLYEFTRLWLLFLTWLINCWSRLLWDRSTSCWFLWSVSYSNRCFKRWSCLKLFLLSFPLSCLTWLNLSLIL